MRIIQSLERRKSELEPLFCYCISAKRYALFNVGPAGEVIIRKASAHGLGQYLPPYDADDAPQSFPRRRFTLDEIGVDRWHYDLWYSIIRPRWTGILTRWTCHITTRLNRPASSRYGATTPALLEWFKTFNAGREYAEQVKPFNFFIAFQARPQFELSDAEQWARPKRGRPRKQLDFKPIAPFNRNVGEAAKAAFDRETGKPMSRGSSRPTPRRWRNIICGPKPNSSTATIATADAPNGGMSSPLNSSTSAKKPTNGRSAFPRRG